MGRRGPIGGRGGTWPFTGLSFLNLNDPDVTHLDPSALLNGAATQSGRTITATLNTGIAANTPALAASWFVPLRDARGKALTDPIGALTWLSHVITPPSAGSNVWIGVGLSDTNAFTSRFVYVGMHYDDATGPEPRTGTHSAGPTDGTPNADGIGFIGGAVAITASTGRAWLSKGGVGMFDSSDALAGSALGLNAGATFLNATPYACIMIGTSAALGAGETMTWRPAWATPRGLETYQIPGGPF